MGWAVGWDTDHNRFRGYGVPAYCDAYANGCRAEIDRGLGYVCEGFDCAREDEDGDRVGCIDIDDLHKSIFVCDDHTCADVDENALPPEHPRWAQHLLTDASWLRWRSENPEHVASLSTTPAPEGDR